MIEFVFETWLGRRPTVNPRVTYIALLHGRFAGLSSLQGGRRGIGLCLPPVLKMQRLKDGVSHA